ncbi:unnamed protein product [Dovyalis caffra]|uniref:Uncharacterized protein n=1 Tax=Dovyalis caffra TaxID=77055 RepID=A0AAV1SA23_9ROSI|nr:unnamed protein product [Dovyalis caffra]
MAEREEAEKVVLAASILPSKPIDFGLNLFKLEKEFVEGGVNFQYNRKKRIENRNY